MKVIDQIGHEVELIGVPQKIISVVPSQTELLFDLGLDEEVRGITKFCIHPNNWYKSKERVGGTKTLNIEKIKELQPDLIIANKEENTKEQIEQLQKLFPVWTSNISNLTEGLEMILEVGKITGKQTKAEQLTQQIKKEFKKLESINHKKSCLYLIWRNPYMSVGKSTFINDVIQRAGFLNVLAHFDENYPIISEHELKELNPDYVLLSSEPYPFKEKHVKEINDLLPKTKVVLVDGEMFSWYGSRLTKSANYIVDLNDKIS